MKSESKLEQILTKGEFAVTSECGPPRGADAEVIRKKGSSLFHVGSLNSSLPPMR